MDNDLPVMFVITTLPFCARALYLVTFLNIICLLYINFLLYSFSLSKAPQTPSSAFSRGSFFGKVKTPTSTANYSFENSIELEETFDVG